MKRALLIGDTALSGHHGCTLVVRRIEAIAAQAGVTVVHKTGFHADLDALTAAEFDGVIVNGEGALHHSSKSAQAIVAAAAWAKQRGLPVALVNSIYQENTPEIDARMDAFDLTYVRDQASQAVLRERGIVARYVPDLSLTFAPPVSWRGEGGPLCFTDSTLTGADRRLFDLARRHQDALYLPLKARPSRGNGGAFENVDRRARFFLKRNVAAWGSSAFYRARYRNAVPRFEAFIEALARQRLVVAGRFHAACIAMTLGVPFCAIRSNSWKVEAVLEEAGVPHRLITLDELERLSGDVLLQRYGAFDVTESESIAAFRADASTRAAEMFAAIEALTPA